MKPNLKQFLIDNNVFDQFCENLKSTKRCNISDFKEFVKDQIQKRTESDGGLFAFIWAETPEGFYFWNNVDTAWQKYYFRCIKDGK